MVSQELTLAGRIFLVRDELGPNPRRPMGRAEFGALVASEEGRATAYAQSAVQKWEEAETSPSLSALAAIARLDPLKRGRDWLTYGNLPNDRQRAGTGEAFVETQERANKNAPRKGGRKTGNGKN